MVGRNTGNQTVTSRGYNVVDVEYGDATTASGFAASTNPATDKQVADLLTANTDSPFTGVNAGTTDTNVIAAVTASALAPVAGIQNVMPNAAIAGFPTTDFFGVSRSWPGAPGAVK